MTERTFYPPSESDIPQHGWRPYSDMHRERIRAHAKHDEAGGSMERKAFDDPAWLPVLVEEIGEVARVLCDAKLGVLAGDVRGKLREELVQLAAMTAAWVDAIDAEPFAGVIPPPVEHVTNRCAHCGDTIRHSDGRWTHERGPRDHVATPANLTAPR